MKFHNLLRASALVLCLLFSDCKSFKNTIFISHTNFSDEIEQNQNLIFTFNKDLISDSLTFNWDTATYILFTPSVKGKFKWTAKNELTFSPVEPFAPNTDYKAVLTEKISSAAKSKWKLDEENTVTFHTPYLKIISAQSFWAISDLHPGEVEVRWNLNFNYKVKPSEISSMLHLLVVGKEVPFELKTSDASSTISMAITPVEQEKKDEGTPVKFTVDKGMHCIGSNQVSKDLLEWQGEIPPKEKLMVMEMTGSFSEGEGVINILMNQPVVDANLKSLLKIDFKNPYTVETLDGGIIIKGAFDAGATYNVLISSKLKGIFGSTLEQDYSQYVSFGMLEPALSFASDKSIYLTPAGAKNIALNISGIEKLKVSVVRIYENNILNFIRRGDSWDSYYEDESYGDNNYHDFNYYNYDNYGDIVSEKIISTKSLARSGGSSLLHLDTEDMGITNNFKGIYIIKLEDVDRQWLQVSKFISFSDIGLIVKQTANDILVFANSIKTIEPIAEVKIKFISSNNQSVASVTTNSSGFAKLENTKTLKPFVIGMVTARVGDDFNFMILDNTQVETSRYDVGGKKSNEANYDCFIYGDRDIYRPGDTVHANAIVRTMDWNTLKDIPVKFKLIAPNGKEYKTEKQNLDVQGSAEVAFALPTSVMTGLYTIEVYSGNDVLLNYSKISVEDFIPDRIKVNLTLSKSDLKSTDSLNAFITATDLFGPPAADRNYEMMMNISRKNFSDKKHNQYNFSIHAADDIPFETINREGKTSAQGEANELFTIPTYNDLGVLKGNILATVFDESGRPVNRLSTFEIATQDVFYGIKKLDRWVNTRQALSIPLIGLNKTGTSVGCTAEVQVIRVNWETVIERRGGGYYYNSQRKEQLLFDKNISVPSDGSVFNYTPLNSGDYEIRVKRPGAENYVAEQFWAYGWGDTQNNSFEVSNEGEVEITLDKAKYAVGDKADLLFNSPFEGKILVTIERDKVFDFYYLNTEKKSASLSISIGENYLPNVYITATAIRELNDNSMPLTVARGFVPLMVEKISNKIPVVISCVEKSRSKTKQIIKVKSAPDAEITIAVVDEGILQLKNFQTPDPYGYFYAKRSLEVNDFDLYPFVFPEIALRKSSVGGDMAEMSKRVNPVTAKRVKLITLWSGVLKTNSAGEVNFTINIPAFSGALRVMAVAYKNKSFGSSDKTIKVADPIVISTSLPRFMSPGDTVSVPVSLSNTTKNSAVVSANINASGPILFVGNISQSVTIGANTEKQVVFKIVAKKDIGVAIINISVNGLNEKFSDQTEIGVRPSSPLQKINDAGSVKGGESITINFKNDFLSSGATSKLVISRSPLVQFTKNLSYLIQYPYGCVEQTVSAAFPQIYYRDLAKAIGQDKTASRYNPDYNVQEAINKLESMQLYNGALSYWQGADYESWWGSAYAAHFLFEANKAGFTVNQKVLNKLYGYLQQKLKSYETETYWYYDENNKLVSKTIAKKEIIYSMYVLGLAGKFDYTSLNYYKSNSSLLSLDCKYLLASTFALAGNNISYLAVLPKIYEGENSVRSFSGSFYSGIRDEALALNALMEVEPENAQVGMMAKHLSQQMKKSYWMNTQECAFSFLALGKVAKRAALSNVNATIMCNGISIGNFTGKDLTINSGLLNQTVNVKTTGTGNIYYFRESEGITQNGNYTQEDKFMKVRKTFLDRFGHPINGNVFEQNDLVVVKITVQSVDYASSIANVAITDMLPAGFEIENPRVGAVPELNWIKDNTEPDNLDIRDDRINFFTTVNATPLNFYYLVRAVSKGKFVMGPVSADAMYNSEYHSINGSGFVVVK